MSHQALERVIGRTILDPCFRAAFFADPDRVLAGFDLSKVERAALMAADAESLEACSNAVGQRMLKVLRKPEGCRISE